MNYIKGKYTKKIFKSIDTDFIVGLFRVIKTDHEEIELGKQITFTGTLPDLTFTDTYIFKGKLTNHIKYGSQFIVHEYEKLIPDEEETIIEYLSSSYIKGCGVLTAKRIYKLFGDKAIDKIKENKDNLLLVEGITAKRAETIYASIIKYDKQDDDLIYLKDLGFSLKEGMKLISTYNDSVKNIIDYNIYTLKKDIDFKTLDAIFLKTNKETDPRRVEALIIETLKEVTFQKGDTYLDKEEIYMYLKNIYNIDINIDDSLIELKKRNEIIINDNNYYLKEEYEDEVYIASSIASLIKKESKTYKTFDEAITKIEKRNNIIYGDKQKEAIKNSLTSSISIITGGPGTGKTTIIKGIIEVYKKLNNITDTDILLLAPTGRAARKMSETSKLFASTIHRFLKWDKENDTFKVNELNKENYKLIIVDEVSMIDNHLMASLFKGINLNTNIIFIGDEYQLPSVSPGLILNDMISSGEITHVRLNDIYRQSDNSYIPSLALNIKDREIDEEILTKKDDYNFIKSSSYDIKNIIYQVITKSLEKGIDENKIQVLAPMYKGENGIDNLNILLQNIFNKKDSMKKEYTYLNKIYREGDKVLNLENNLDLEISNGDIGCIIEINPHSKDELIIVDYEGNIVPYNIEMLRTITHAYAITIHKSQGNEFDHIIMPVTLEYSRMLYNKLLYTGVSRAKKSLILIGSPEAFVKGVNNNYSVTRKTNLKEKINKYI